MHTTTRTALALACGLALPLSAAQAEAPSAASVLLTYADIAEATYSDSLTTAEALDRAIEALVASPSEAKLEAARKAWLAARVPYQQSEVYRFGNAIVDDWEGRVNAWPLDEGLIDYVDSVYGDSSPENRFYRVNVVASPTIQIGGRTIDASTITPALLQDELHEVDGIEANVSTGYHAIEFLLWGQDLNGTGPGAGNRPYTDFDLANCTGGNCDRRIDYLRAASQLLLSDLQEMVAAWGPIGAARNALFEESPEAGILTILTGMGSLSYGELAGERMKLGLLLNDPEEEHDCFSDNTHNSHYYDILGIQNVYLGRYKRVDGSLITGASLADYVAGFAPELDGELKAALAKTKIAAETMVARAEGGEAYDQMIGPGNAEGNAVVQAVIDDLIAQTRSIERIVVALNIGQIEIEGSDSLDDPNAVFE
ncbi:MAG: imelysin family protein [Kiloniellales bacterium]